MSNVIYDILFERIRQLNIEGFTSKHDDEHDHGELATAAACYALTSVPFPLSRVTPLWPWSKDSLKPKTKRSDLVSAAALIIAEIERLDRVAQGKDVSRG